MRTGDEPIHARSALRTRRWMALWGLFWAAAGASVFVLAGQTGWAAACAAVALVAAVDLGVITHRIHQGPHYQPGPDVPPYSPGHPPRH